MHEAYRKRSRPRKPRSLLDFVRDAGGIDPGQPDAGELKAMDAHLIRSRRGVNNLIRPKAGQGRKVDDVCSLAIEAGYLPQGSGINDLLNAVDLELRGLRTFYPLADVDAVPLPPEPEIERPKRGRGRPPKPEGALVNGPSFRLAGETMDKLAELAPRYGMPLRSFARRCLEAGLRELSGEGF